MACSLIYAVKTYIRRMVSDVVGLKCLLLDKDTTGMVSVVFSQTQMFAEDVFLVERLDMVRREPMYHLKAICFLRPTGENIRTLTEELRSPKFGEYHLFFSNTLAAHHVEALAEADCYVVVKTLQECYADFYALNSHLFSLNIPSCVPLLQPSWDAAVFERITNGLVSCLLALRKKPIVRYQRSSDIAKHVALEVAARIESEYELFDFRRPDTPPVLLILDRRDDPVTPLLQQWTYEAMVHELIGISNNRVDLRGVPGLRKELQEVILSPEQDNFYADHLYDNFGDLGENLQDVVDQFQRQMKTNKAIESIEDMKRFVEEYPEFRKMQGNVSKHVTLTTELSHIVEQRHLFEVSELEQELAATEDQSSGYRRMMELLQAEGIHNADRLRIALLYALRYEREGSKQLGSVIDLLLGSGISRAEVQLLGSVYRYAGEEVRTPGLFDKGFFNTAKRSVARGLKGVANVYTQHQPLLQRTLEQLMRGRMRDTQYPFALGSAQRERPQDVIVFIVGGATLAEAHAVEMLGRSFPAANVFLGGTRILNSKSFLGDVGEYGDMQRTAEKHQCAAPVP